MLTKEKVIARYIRDTAAEPFKWGQTDCALWATGLFAQVNGEDPAQEVRGSYSSWIEARHVMMAWGGLEAMCRRLMATYEASERENGICLAKVGNRSFCGILSGGRLSLKSARNGIVSPEEFTIIEGWGLCRRP